MLGRVRCQFNGQAVEFRWSPGEGTDARGYHDTTRSEHLAVAERNSKTIRTTVNSADRSPIEIRHSLLLIPMSILYETIQRHWLRDATTALRSVCLQRQCKMRIRDLRSSPIGAQKHADRHVALPKRHRLAENADL